MKITLGTVVIETDYIEKINAGEFDGDSNQFLAYIENIDREQRKIAMKESNPRPENR